MSSSPIGLVRHGQLKSMKFTEKDGGSDTDDSDPGVKVGESCDFTWSAAGRAGSSVFGPPSANRVDYPTHFESFGPCLGISVDITCFEGLVFRGVSESGLRFGVWRVDSELSFSVEGRVSELQGLVRLMV